MSLLDFLDQMDRILEKEKTHFGEAVCAQKIVCRFIAASVFQ